MWLHEYIGRPTNDRIRWIEENLDIQLYDWQRVILGSEHHRKVLVGGRTVGKTTAMICDAIYNAVVLGRSVNILTHNCSAARGVAYQIYGQLRYKYSAMMRAVGSSWSIEFYPNGRLAGRIYISTSHPSDLVGSTLTNLYSDDTNEKDLTYISRYGPVHNSWLNPRLPMDESIMSLCRGAMVVAVPNSIEVLDSSARYMGAHVLLQNGFLTQEEAANIINNH